MTGEKSVLATVSGAVAALRDFQRLSETCGIHKQTKFRVSPVWDFDPSSQVIPDCNSQLVQTEPVPSGSTEAEQFVADHKRWFQSATRGLDQRIGHT